MNATMVILKPDSVRADVRQFDRAPESLGGARDSARPMAGSGAILENASVGF
jgi:hypothetical protein